MYFFQVSTFLNEQKCNWTAFSEEDVKEGIFQTDL